MPTPPPTEPPTPRPTYTPAEWEAIIETALGYAEECEPPCWHSITPGVSTQYDVVVKLEQLKRDAGIVSTWGGGGNQYGGVLVGSSMLVDIFLKDGNVEYMRGDFYFSGIPVDQVIERFGEPEKVGFIGRHPEMDLSCDDFELDRASGGDPTGGFFLLYSSQGVTFSGYRYSYGLICPRMVASRFYYYPPVSLSDALSDNESRIFGLTSVDSVNTVEWHGYGKGY